ncbi:hypothetical protein BAC3_01682 [uncultured bacterium]|nr:hypothetical protein BAC3_01682 [uncultured bacterium]
MRESSNLERAVYTEIHILDCFDQKLKIWLQKDLFNKKKAKNELKKINKELKYLKSKIIGLEIRKNELTQIMKA